MIFSSPSRQQQPSVVKSFGSFSSTIHICCMLLYCCSHLLMHVFDHNELRAAYHWFNIAWFFFLFSMLWQQHSHSGQCLMLCVVYAAFGKTAKYGWLVYGISKQRLLPWFSQPLKKPLFASRHKPSFSRLYRHTSPPSPPHILPACSVLSTYTSSSYFHSLCWVRCLILRRGRCSAA